MDQLNKKIEELRNELCKSYGSQETLKVSQKLDYYIVKSQKTFYNQKPPPGSTIKI